MYRSAVINLADDGRDTLTTVFVGVFFTAVALRVRLLRVGFTGAVAVAVINGSDRLTHSL
tara:strand:- start:5166 stop:5345 length:180 start_codon:yes stop_codon:yes gene_type:complete